MHSTDFAWLSDEELLEWLTVRDRRPNLLVLAHGIQIEAVTDRLMTVCMQPITISLLPGTLYLPPKRRGTVLLQNVTALSLPQQILLNDWIAEGRGDAQIVSIAATHPWRLVQSGEFLEGLFYRLNVVCLNATSRTSDAGEPGTCHGLPSS